MMLCEIKKADACLVCQHLLREPEQFAFHGSSNGLCSVCTKLVTTAFEIMPPAKRCQTEALITEVPEVLDAVRANKAAREATSKWVFETRSDASILTPVVAPLLKSERAFELVVRGLERTHDLSPLGDAMAKAVNAVPGLLSAKQGARLIKLSRSLFGHLRGYKNEHIVHHLIADKFNRCGDDWNGIANGIGFCYYEESTIGMWEARGGFHDSMLQRRVWWLEREYGHRPRFYTEIHALSEAHNGSVVPVLRAAKALAKLQRVAFLLGRMCLFWRAVFAEVHFAPRGRGFKCARKEFESCLERS